MSGNAVTGAADPAFLIAQLLCTTLKIDPRWGTHSAIFTALRRYK
jgi:hypothetical protein